ncbi:MAG: low-complexity tail membrane protein [Pseudanabaena sp. Salubria-1]|nr:low-complexity tail membrane protein [Pseudanabaena sp. Salubria-1]
MSFFKSFKSEPFLWIHLSGIVAFPIFLGITWLGLSISDRLSLFWIEILLMMVIGIVPIFLMQWSRPFEIFSLLILAMKPDKITDRQRQILSLFKMPKQRLLSVVTALVMLVILYGLYQLPPLSLSESLGEFPMLVQVKSLGLIIAYVAFAGANLFLQVPISVLGVLSNNEQQFAEIAPYPTEKILQDFTLAGFQVDKIMAIKQSSLPK